MQQHEKTEIEMVLYRSKYGQCKECIMKNVYYENTKHYIR